jgi:hypothetical protein
MIEEGNRYLDSTNIRELSKTLVLIPPRDCQLAMSVLRKPENCLGVNLKSVLDSLCSCHGYSEPRGFSTRRSLWAVEPHQLTTVPPEVQVAKRRRHYPEANCLGQPRGNVEEEHDASEAERLPLRKHLTRQASTAPAP